MVYLPREDSYLLKTWVEKEAKGSVLDIGTGTGIQAIAAAPKAKNVIAVDLDPNALEYAKNQVEVHGISNIEFRQGSLFEPIRKEEQFDLIIFNPPYLPADKWDKDISTTGGKHGWETIEKFLRQARGHLKEKGKILLVFSSLTTREKVLEIAGAEKYVAKLLQKKHFPFEDLFVYELTTGK